MSDEDTAGELPSENVLVKAQAIMSVIRENPDAPIQTDLETELDERMSDERREAFFEDANIKAIPMDDAPTAETPISVEIGTGFVAIHDEDEELVRWLQDEWEANPTLAPTIANAVHLAHTAPQDLRKRLSRRNGMSNDYR